MQQTIYGYFFPRSSVQCEDVTQSTNYSRIEYLFGLKIFPLRPMEWLLKKNQQNISLSPHNPTSWTWKKS